jgi:hypothetical protein
VSVGRQMGVGAHRTIDALHHPPPIIPRPPRHP